MSKLITVCDFSPMQALSAALLNAAIPAAGGGRLALGPFNSLLWELVPTHTSLWTVRTDKLPLPRNIRTQWDEIAARLDSGCDVLLHSPTIFRQAHEFFHRQLEERIDRGRHSLHSIVTLGSPILLLELYHRHPGFQPTAAAIDTYVSRLLGLPALVRLLQDFYGPDSVTFFANTATSATAAPDAHILGQIMAQLDLPLPPKLPRTIANAAFRSHLTRRLRAALEVRDNAWPAIDPDLIEEALHRTDASLPEDLRSPLGLRQKFAEMSRDCVRELEGFLHLEEGSLAPQEYLLTTEAKASPAALPADVIDSFCAHLGQPGAKALRARLDNDALLLTADQKAVRARLEGEAAYTHIGEAVPPVELTVLTMAYNHEKFIAQCMDSVIAQKTDFPVRHIVLDHHSEDGTPNIIARYAEKHKHIRPVLLSHRRVNENVWGLFARCRSRYVALCDGDDYFLKPDKLQKQVDFLEKNPDHALCFHPVLAVFEDGRKPVIYPPLENLPQRKSGQIYLSDLVSTNFIQTNSVVYRWRFTDGLPAWFRPDLCPGDWYWHLLHAELGKIGFIPEIMSAYRRHAGALYAQVWESRLNHRRNLGLAELATYQACDEHFRYRFHRPLSVLASSVFADFVELMMKEDEDRYLNFAVERYPDFARHFLNSLSALEQEQKGKQGDRKDG